MRVSNNIFKMFIPDLNVDGKEFSELLTMTGTKVESFIKLDKNLSNIIVVQIKKIDKH